ncbi:FAD-dependent monooxygenase [Nocardia sp. NPDC020380]|uniref:FAD-dependent monooxygenase n=1 Tax=Nocardia sp. NPDC020380 TaxID=3364309 RepID=UPI0037AEDF1D
MLEGTNIPATTVLILGAGPAGLVLANLLCETGIECIVLERRSREHVEQRARAGFLTPDSVAVLREHGLAEGLNATGKTHSLCEFRSAAGRFELNYDLLGDGGVHTVYPQQALVTDLIAELLRRGGTIHFETTVEALGDPRGDRPWVLARDGAGRELRYTAHYLAGCDGARGVARGTVPSVRAAREHDITWLALLAQAPPTTHTVIYGVHPDGFAGQMPRSPDITRYYLQCDPGVSPDDWSESRIWRELGRRLDAERYGPLSQGPIIERSLVRLRSEILDPIQHGRLCRST